MTLIPVPSTPLHGSATATDGCQECLRESRGDRVMSHDKRTCTEVSTWHVQLFLSCWSSRTFLSSGLRRFFFSVSRPRAASPRCVSAACTASSCHLERRRESSMVCALFSLTPPYGGLLLPRQFDESSNSHCSAQPTSSSSWTSPTQVHDGIMDAGTYVRVWSILAEVFVDSVYLVSHYALRGVADLLVPSSSLPSFRFARGTASTTRVLPCVQV